MVGEADGVLVEQVERNFLEVRTHHVAYLRDAREFFQYRFQLDDHGRLSGRIGQSIADFDFQGSAEFLVYSWQQLAKGVSVTVTARDETFITQCEVVKRVLEDNAGLAAN